MKKIMCSLIAWILVVAIFTGCSGNKTTSVTGTTTPQATTPETIALENITPQTTTNITPIPTSNLNSNAEPEHGNMLNDSESQMKSALTSENMNIFQISNDFSFKNNTAMGSFIVNGDNIKMTPQQAQNNLMSFFVGKTIRINAGVVTVDDQDYQCKLNILPGGDGIEVNITRGNINSVNQGQLQGVIKGNTLTATASVIESTNVMGVGNGFNATGEFNVSIYLLPVSQWPPLPPVNVNATENSDQSIQLTWEDPNPEGVFIAYEIYRYNGISVNSSKIATVSNCSSWVDTSDVAKTYMVLSYYIVARAMNGKESTFSKLAVPNFNSLYNRFGY